MENSFLLFTSTHKIFFTFHLNLLHGNNKNFPLSTVQKVPYLVEVCCWTINGEQLSISLVMESLHQWELDLGIVELLDIVTACLDCCHLFNLNNL